MNFIYGLGGRDIFPADIEQAFLKAEEVAQKGRVEKHIDYLGLRE
jgi:pyruvate/2-oxoacid:ferredoxin oxidoreductase alpha subunit